MIDLDAKAPSWHASIAVLDWQIFRSAGTLRWAKSNYIIVGEKIFRPVDVCIITASTYHYARKAY
jgi:hypothetical protein